MHNATQVTKNKQPKPDLLMLYDHTKGQADVANLVSAHKTTPTKHQFWLMNGLSFILDTVRTNDKMILLQCGYKVKFSSFDFECT